MWSHSQQPFLMWPYCQQHHDRPPHIFPMWSYNQQHPKRSASCFATHVAILAATLRWPTSHLVPHLVILATAPQRSTSRLVYLFLHTERSHVCHNGHPEIVVSKHPEIHSAPRVALCTKRSTHLHSSPERVPSPLRSAQKGGEECARGLILLNY